MRKASLMVVLVATGAALFVAVGSSASGDGGERFAVGFRLGFTGQTTSAGTFTAAGGVDDAGNSSAAFTLTPVGGDRARLEGTQTLVGSHGRITISFRGPAGPLSSRRQFGRGRCRLVSGTGAYAGIRGRCRFVVAVDIGAGTLTGTFDGKVRSHP
jgi:hypothetical protein